MSRATGRVERSVYNHPLKRVAAGCQPNALASLSGHPIPQVRPICLKPLPKRQCEIPEIYEYHRSSNGRACLIASILQVRYLHNEKRTSRISSSFPFFGSAGVSPDKSLARATFDNVNLPRGQYTFIVERPTANVKFQSQKQPLGSVAAAYAFRYNLRGGLGAVLSLHT